jgi:hypothetical protein
MVEPDVGTGAADGRLRGRATPFDRLNLYGATQRASG